MTDEDATRVEIDTDTMDTIGLYKRAKALAKSYSEEAATHYEAIMTALHAAADTEPETIVGTWGGDPVVRMAVVWTRRLDSDKLKKASPSTYDEFSVTRPVVRLTIPSVQ